jgi:hypothetical protein
MPLHRRPSFGLPVGRFRAVAVCTHGSHETRALRFQIIRLWRVFGKDRAFSVSRLQWMVPYFRRGVA